MSYKVKNSSYFIYNISFKTPNILSPTEMRSFWIDIKKEGNGVRIEAGKGTEATGFMSRSWNSNRYNSWPPTQVAFAAWLTKVDYKFCLKNQPGKKYLQHHSMKSNLLLKSFHTTTTYLPTLTFLCYCSAPCWSDLSM